MKLRVWRYAAILVAVLGLVLLWGVARRAEIPLARIQDVHSDMDWAYVRVQGVVARHPDYDPITDRLTFWLEDGTGQVLVILNRGESQVLFDRGQVPTIGDQVSVAGTVNVRMTKVQGALVSLTVSEPKHLEIQVPTPIEASIADAAAEAQYRKVLVQGRVIEMGQPYEGLTSLRIQDDTGEIDVVYEQSLVWLSGTPTTILPGDLVSVQGAVTSYGGQAQIVLDTASGLRRLPALAVQAEPVQVDAVQVTEVPSRPVTTLTSLPASPTPTALVVAPSPTPTLSATVAPVPTARDAAERMEPIADAAGWVQTGLVSTALVGRTVTVEGHIEQATLLSAGCKSIVDDGSGPAVIWMSNVLYGQLVDPEGWNVGGVVRVAGMVSEYQGELEIVPQTQDAIVIVQRAPLVVLPDAQTGNLSVADLGRRVTVEGTIVTVEPFSAGVQCVLDDGSGDVILLLWQNVFEALPDRRALAVGGRVRASGWVDEFRGELEIIPGLALDVVALGATGTP